MKQVEWSEDYAIGNKLIDGEHKQLFSLINDLYLAEKDANTLEESDRKMNEVFKRLSNYIDVHFSDEEKLMEREQWEELDYHKELHRKFVIKVEELQRLCNEDSNTYLPSVITFLEQWLVQHIRGKDKKFGSYLKAKGN